MTKFCVVLQNMNVSFPFGIEIRRCIFSLKHVFRAIGCFYARDVNVLSDKLSRDDFNV